MQLCNDCPRKCNVSRNPGNLGVCGETYLPRVARAGLHFGEEPCISGSRGSGTVFFSGCSLKCVFCQNCDISHNGFGKQITPERLAEIFKELENLGAHNINLVTPTHFISAIKDALKYYKPKIPLVYNCSGYEDLSVIGQDIFDIYLFDMKFFSSEKSLKYAKCGDYFEQASKALLKAYAVKGRPLLDGEGIMQSGIIVRHLILPQCTNDALRIIEWLDSNTPDIFFSLMSQYVPMYKAAEYPEINRRITKREYDKVVDACFDKKFAHIYVQSMKSATDEMIPSFDLTGV